MDPSFLIKPHIQMNIEYYEWKKSIIKDENFTKDIQSNQICRPKLISNKVRKYFVHVLIKNFFPSFILVVGNKKVCSSLPRYDYYH